MIDPLVKAFLVICFLVLAMFSSFFCWFAYDIGATAGAWMFMAITAISLYLSIKTIMIQSRD